MQPNMMSQRIKYHFNLTNISLCKPTFFYIKMIELSFVPYLLYQAFIQIKFEGNKQKLCRI